jgi:predicted lipoprotein with Yx(FWY)xxD motif
VQPPKRTPSQRVITFVRSSPSSVLRTRRTLVAPAFVVALALVLVGCGSSKPSPVSHASAAASTTSTASTHTSRAASASTTSAAQTGGSGPSAAHTQHQAAVANTLSRSTTTSASSTRTAPTAAHVQPAAARPPAPTPGVAVDASSSSLGTILVSGGRTLYLFEKDNGSTSSCYGSCASVWPPLVTKGAPQAGSGVNSSLLATTARSDGTSEVTYNGHPLYFYAGDSSPGQTTGQGLNQFGGLWYAVSPSGGAIRSGGRPSSAY